MTSTTAIQTLRLTRDQLKVVAHGDAEIIKQLERMVALVNTLAAQTTSVVAAGSLEDGDAAFSRTLAVGRYLVRMMTITTGTVTTSQEHTATFEASKLSVTIGNEDLAYVEAADVVDGQFFSTTDNRPTHVWLEGVVTVTSSGRFGVRITGSGTVLAGGYLSAERIA